MTTTLTSFTCPWCGSVSHNVIDVQEGYCGRCHWWTGDDKIPMTMRPCQECGTPVLCLMLPPPAITLGPRSCANHQ